MTWGLVSLITTWARDGLGRALVVTENGTARRRVFDGALAVVDGPTRITRGPGGGVLVETTDTVVGHGRNATTVAVPVDVLTDLLGTPLTIAEAGVVSDDLAWTGDFGDTVAAPGWDTVTGYTGHLEATGLVETPTRTYDPGTRVWMQEDTWPGTATVSATQNRYTYGQGAPETYVDPTGRTSAQAAILAQRLPASELAYVMGLLAMCRAFPVEDQCQAPLIDGVRVWTETNLELYRWSGIQAAITGLEMALRNGELTAAQAVEAAGAIRLLQIGVRVEGTSLEEAFVEFGTMAAGVVVGGVVFFGCEAMTGGTGSFGCAAASGAAGSATTAALGYATNTPQYRWDLGDASLYIGEAAVAGAALGVAGRTVFGPGIGTRTGTGSGTGVAAETGVGLPELAIGDAQFGAKVGQHAQDFGLNPGVAADRVAFRNLIDDIHANPTEIRQGPWNPANGGGSDYLFYRQGSDVVVTRGTGDFVTILRGGESNGWFQAANGVS